MKKLCISFCTGISLVKGTYVTLFMLLITVSGFSQSSEFKKDSSSGVFKKWEVSLDLKPVFRSDQPFKLFIAKNLTERSAIRFGIMGLYIGNNDVPTVTNVFKDSLLFNQSGAIRGDTFVSIGTSSQPQVTFQYNIGFSIGYRKELFWGKLSMYSSIDFGYNKSYYSNSFGLIPNTKFVTGGSFSTSQKITYSTNDFNLIQSLGLRYRISKNISFAIESNITLGYSKYNNYSITYFAPTVDAISTNQDGNNIYFRFNQLSNLFLNYHF